MGLRERIGIDVGRKLRLEDAIEWAAAHAVRWIDIQLDTGPNALGSFDDAPRRRDSRALASGTASISACTRPRRSMSPNTRPMSATRSTHYLKAYVEIAPRLGAEWIVMHAGFHFTSDKEMRMKAGLERLQRIVAHAERHGALVLLENLNKEPEEAEVHYLAHTVEEWRYYFDRIKSPAFKLSFTANHAHLVPEGVGGLCRGARHEPGRRGAARRLLAQRL